MEQQKPEWTSDEKHHAFEWLRGYALSTQPGSRHAAIMLCELSEALELLKTVEFTTAVTAKCPVCLGFEMPHGEQSYKHNAKCKLAAFLKHHEPNGVRN